MPPHSSLELAAMVSAAGHCHCRCCCCWAQLQVLLLCAWATSTDSTGASGTTSAPANSSDPARPLLHVTVTPKVLAAGGNIGIGDAVGLVHNEKLARFEVMWDSNAACGWGHVSTSDFLTFVDHGCAGPNRTGGPTMSGSIAFRPDGVPLAAVGWKGDIFLSTADDERVAWFSPPPSALGMDQAAVGPSNCNFCPPLPIGKRCQQSCSTTKFANVNSSFINDPFLFARKEEPGRMYLLSSGSMRDQNGPTGVPQSLLWASDDAPGFLKVGSWKFVSRFWSGNWEAYGPRTSCVDTFALSGKQIFLFSDCKYHRVRWFVGKLTEERTLDVETEGIADWGRLYASQSMDTPDGRRLLIGNIGHPGFCTGTKLLPIGGTDWNSMLSYPRQIHLDAQSSRLTFAPADELRTARVASTHVVVEPTTVSCGTPVALGSAQGNTREVRLSLQQWTNRTPGGSCGFQLRHASNGSSASPEAGCVLEVMFTAAPSVVVRSWCGSPGSSHEKAECLAGSDDAFNKSSLAGYCYNISLPVPSTATNGPSELSALIDRSVVEVFAAGGQVVISSGVFVDSESATAVVELTCDSGGGAVMAAEGWMLLKQ